jgi:hypothetical protein
MKVYVDKINKISDYDDDNKWADYRLLIYLNGIFDSKGL